MPRFDARKWWTRMAWAAHRGRCSHQLGRWLFLRLLGVVYLIAFVSLWTQVDGLIGADGILPAAEYLDWFEQRLGGDAVWRLPTLAWIDSSDRFLHLLCAAGVVCALALVADLATLPALLLCWLIYLSMVNVGQVFFNFQWDALLLESGLVAAFLAPVGLRPRAPWNRPPPRRAALWLLRLLLFKLMFLSGIVKLLVLDETWWKLSALDYHYFTQPLPAWTSWYAHQLPGWFQRLSVVVMFLVELGAPFLLLLTRGPRLVGALATMVLMLLIAATGNYTFFNLLTAVLCIPLIDDQLLRRLVPARIRPALAASPPPVEPAANGPVAAGPPRRAFFSTAGGLLRGAAISLLLVLSAISFVREIVRTPRQPLTGVAGILVDWGGRYVLSWGEPHVLRRVAPFRSVNGYGLFRAMTTSRPEIVIEGSRDGRRWIEYEFRWKPGDLSRRPGFVAPHQPRLDWQMWFAALNPRGAGWLRPLMLRLLEGEPSVLALLGENPFSGAPPRFIRLAYYDYEFTTPLERRRSGDWWKRTPRGHLTRPLTATDLGRLP